MPCYQPPGVLFLSSLPLSWFFFSNSWFLAPLLPFRKTLYLLYHGLEDIPLFPSVLYLPHPDSKWLHHIYVTQLGRFLEKADFVPDVRDACEVMVTVAMGLYFDLSANLLPTPAKSHYTFNLRDLNKVSEWSTYRYSIECYFFKRKSWRNSKGFRWIRSVIGSENSFRSLGLSENHTQN